jgi:hypothetical protein
MASSTGFTTWPDVEQQECPKPTGTVYLRMPLMSANVPIVSIIDRPNSTSAVRITGV